MYGYKWAYGLLVIQVRSTDGRLNTALIFTLGWNEIRTMSFETIISVGLLGWMTMGFILMGLGIW